jgi:hypothetical protein
MRETGEAKLRVHGGMRHGPKQLRHRKSIGLELKSHGHIGRERQETPGRQLHLAPAQVAHVASACLRIAVVHGQIELPALGHQGNAHIIEEHFAIVQPQPVHHEFEHTFAQRLARRVNLRRRHVARAVAFDAHVHLRAA